MALTVLTFEAARQYDALFQSLENELAYVQQAQQKGLGASTKAGQGVYAAIQAKPGTTCRARWSLRVLETMRSENGKQVAVAGVWHGTLTTGEVRFRIVEKDAGTRQAKAPAGPTGTGEDAAAEKPALPANRDWPEVERILYTDTSGKECAIDLDTGKLYALPKEYNRVVYPRHEIVGWAKNHQIDLFYPAKPSFGHLTCVGLGLRALDNTTWEKATREDIRDFFGRLGTGKMEAAETMSPLWADNTTGAAPSYVYAFVTNEGTKGIVQMVGTVGPYDGGAPSGVKIRYRIIASTSVYHLKHISADEASRVFRQVLTDGPRITIMMDARINSIIIVAPPEVRARAEQLLRQADVPSKQTGPTVPAPGAQDGKRSLPGQDTAPAASTISPAAELKTLQAEWKVLRVEKGKDADTSWAAICQFGSMLAPETTHRLDFRTNRDYPLSVRRCSPPSVSTCSQLANAQGLPPWYGQGFEYRIDPAATPKTIDLLQV